MSGFVSRWYPSRGYGFLSLFVVSGCFCFLVEDGPIYGVFPIAEEPAGTLSLTVHPAAYLGGTVEVMPFEAIVTFEHQGHVFELVYDAISECEAFARKWDVRKTLTEVDIGVDTADSGFDLKYWTCQHFSFDTGDCCDTELGEFP